MRQSHVSPHQVALSGGVKFGKINFSISAKYVDAMRRTASRGSIGKDNKIPSHFVADSVLFYSLSQDARLFAAVDNILNRAYAVSSNPAGFRSGKPLAARVGMVINF